MRKHEENPGREQAGEAAGQAYAGQANPGEAPGAEGEARKDLYWYLDRIWNEIKDLSSQVEHETRRGSRIAKLRFELRGLRRDLDEKAATLGKLLYEVQMAGDKRPTLSRVEGYDEAIEAMADLNARIDAKMDEIAQLREQEPVEETVA